MKATHMKKKEEGKMSSRSQNGKNTSNLRKIQLEWSTTRRKAIYPIKKKTLNYLALLGALLCHCVIAPALQAAGSKRGLSPRRRRPQAVILVAGDLNQDPILSRGGGSSDI